MSFKKNIEEPMTERETSVNVTGYENPSPSRDPWFDDPENIAIVMRGIEDVKAGRWSEITTDEIRKMIV